MLAKSQRYGYQAHLAISISTEENIFYLKTVNLFEAEICIAMIRPELFLWLSNHSIIYLRTIKPFQQVLKKIILFSKTVNLFGAEICIAMI